jgi:hypothetical protein
VNKSNPSKTPKNLERVMSLRGDSRVITGYQGKDQNLAKVTRQVLWHCKVCDQYFETLGEAKEHSIGKRH